jgi:hypothetical protein
MPRQGRTHEPRQSQPQFCTVGAMLCRLRVWSEPQWDALPAAERPATREHVPGLGWVAAVPVENLN